MFGVVGWAIAVPVVVGTFIGIWIDLHWPSAYSWTLMLLVIGLFIGCMNAWFWIQKQRRAISEELENNASE
jgi:ATP synthase protein I